MTTVLVTTQEAAHLLAVPPARIRKWAQRRLLTPAGRRGRERLYDVGDVYATEAAIHQRRAVIGGGA